MGSGVSREQNEQGSLSGLGSDKFSEVSDGGSTSRKNSKEQATEQKYLQAVSEARRRRRVARLHGLKSFEDDIVNTVTISKGSFSHHTITLFKGQCLLLEWEEQSGPGFNVLQVISDGQELRSVVGGFNTGGLELQGLHQLFFNLEGEFRFISGGNIKSTPLSVLVGPKPELNIQVKDDGFHPNIIKVYKDTVVRWMWKDCNFQHSIFHVQYCSRHHSFIKKTTSTQTPTLSGSYVKEFKKPGLYFYQTESDVAGHWHLCVVLIHDCPREFRIEVLDNKFLPMMLKVEVGDKVWWSWDKSKCRKPHAVYQVEAPSFESEDDQPVPIDDGFKWPTPSKAGLMCHIFQEPGVYYYSDHNYTEVAEYIGLVVVVSKAKEHFVDITQHGFKPDLLCVESDELVWCSWESKEHLDETCHVVEIERFICGKPGMEENHIDCSNECEFMDDANRSLMAGLSTQTIQLSATGVYQFQVSDNLHNIGSLSIVITPASQVHIVKMTRDGFYPRVLALHPGDRILWLWEDVREPHNIVQVSHQGTPIEGGFCSGPLRYPPGAFTYQFFTVGVFYFMSATYPKQCGAVVVSSQMQICPVDVKEISSEPTIIRVNDVVCWLFQDFVRKDLMEASITAKGAGSLKPKTLVYPRRCLARSFTKAGLFHYTCHEFRGKVKGSPLEKIESLLQGTPISSIIVEDPSDYYGVNLNLEGFLPNILTIRKSESILWNWKESKEPHNIVHVQEPESFDAPLKVVQGATAFSSGKPIASSSFLYTFDEPGTFCVTSQGAAGHVCTIIVVDNDVVVTPPFISSEKTGGRVERGYRVSLSCSTPRAKIVYTKDGSPPLLNNSKIKFYNKAKGICLRRSGFTIIRAMAIVTGLPCSPVFTSMRYHLIPSELHNDYDSDSSVESLSQIPDVVRKHSIVKCQWWKSAPVIKGCQVAPGVIEIFWEPPSKRIEKYIKGYQLYLNGCSYSSIFSSNCICLRASGLSGGKRYKVQLLVISNQVNYLPEESNILIIDTPSKTDDEGPVISLEVVKSPTTLAVVWNCQHFSSSVFRIYLNGHRVGEKVVPEEGSLKCRVVIQDCELHVKHNVLIRSTDNKGVTTKSNFLEVTLPLKTDHIRKGALNGTEVESDNDYIVVEGGGQFLEDTKNGHSQNNGKVKSSSKYLVKSSEEQMFSKTTPVKPQDLSLDLKQRTSYPAKKSKQMLPCPKVVIFQPAEDSPRTDQPMSITFEKDAAANIESPKEQTIETNTNKISKNKALEDGHKPKGTNVNKPEDVHWTVVRTDTDPEDALQVSIIQDSMDAINISWQTVPDLSSEWKLIGYSVIVEGEKFGTDIDSNSSFECQVMKRNVNVPGIRHLWNTDESKNHMTLHGLLPSHTYSIYIEARYYVGKNDEWYQDHITSDKYLYVTLGPPQSPVVNISDIGENQISICWEPGDCHSSVLIQSYVVLVDKQTFGLPLNANCRETTISNFEPGKQYQVSLVALSGETSLPSEPLSVICPQIPKAPIISYNAGCKAGSVILSWEHPDNNNEELSHFRIFLDGVLHGKLPISANDKTSYQYIIYDLQPSQPYEVKVKSISGQKSAVAPYTREVQCLTASEFSNSITVYSSAPPSSPCLQIENINQEGVSVSWQVPQELGDASVSGYQLLKNKKAYGNVLSADCMSMWVKGLTLGETFTLQLLALTEHIVGRTCRMLNHYTDSEKDSGVLVLPGQENKEESLFGDRYSACKPGPPLIIQYTSLVSPPLKVHCDRVTAFSALMVWKQEIAPKPHYIIPDNYQVTWWPGIQAQDNILSESVSGKNFNILNLKPGTQYSIIVEARKIRHYSQLVDSQYHRQAPEYRHSSFILSAKSSVVTVMTSSYPEPVRNIGLVDCTCHSIKLAWDPPPDRGVEIVGLHLKILPISDSVGKPQVYTLLPDCVSYCVHDLIENAQYQITITVVTEEFFQQLPTSITYKKTKILPAILPRDNRWLPNVSIIVQTAGSLPSVDLILTNFSTSFLRIKWKPAKAYGTNQIIKTILHWVEIERKGIMKEKPLVLKNQVELDPCTKSFTLNGLLTCAIYQIIVEAVIKVKNQLDCLVQDSTDNFRLTRIMSEPFYACTAFPTEVINLLIFHYSQTSIHLSWTQPALHYTFVEEHGIKRHLRLKLLDYSLTINDQNPIRFKPGIQQCIINKCRTGRSYHLQLKARIDLWENDLIMKRNKRYQSPLDGKEEKKLDNLLDVVEEVCVPILVTLPKDCITGIREIKAIFLKKYENGECMGYIRVEWISCDAVTIDYFEITWYHIKDPQCKDTVNIIGQENSCDLPILSKKCIHEVCVKTILKEGQINCLPPLQVFACAAPDAPELWLNAMNKERAIIEWNEPKTYGIDIAGYQIFVNDKEVGNVLKPIRHRAGIYCQDNSPLVVQVSAVSCDPDYGHSQKSAPLYLVPGISAVDDHLLTAYLPEEDIIYGEDVIQMKVTEVSDLYIRLQWPRVQESLAAQASLLRIEWSSLAKSESNIYDLDINETKFKIDHCHPGLNHFIRMLLVSKNQDIIYRSPMLTVETSAPPDVPHLQLRIQNTKYVAVEWSKPREYGQAFVTGYKVFVNGTLETLLSIDHLSFTHTGGVWCQTYIFQVQALTAFPNLYSKISEPLCIDWPGVRASQLCHVPTRSPNNIRIVWEALTITGGIAVSYLMAICSKICEKEYTFVKNMGPLHPDTLEVEFLNLPPSELGYLLHLEIHLQESNIIVKSESLHIQPAISPDPPKIVATIIGLEERKQIEKVTCSFLNTRDRLLKIIHADYIESYGNPSIQVLKATEELLYIELKLKDCLNSLMHYTGYLLVALNWICPQSQAQMKLAGFKILLNGKQYGGLLSPDMKRTKIKLPLDEKCYFLTMQSVSKMPQLYSEDSNVIELITNPFQPFQFFCFNDVHKRGERWPDAGCCAYKDSFAQEPPPHAQNLLNPGLLRNFIPPVNCNVTRISDGKILSLMPVGGVHVPTIILFWTPWCLTSKGSLQFFAKFAASFQKYSCISCAFDCNISLLCRESILKYLEENNCFDIPNMQYYLCNLPVYIHNSDDQEVKSSTVPEVFNIVGVPMINIIHPTGYIAWKGRYCAFNYEDFEKCLLHSLSEVSVRSCPVSNCFLCEDIINISTVDKYYSKASSASVPLLYRPLTPKKKVTMPQISTPHISKKRLPIEPSKEKIIMPPLVSKNKSKKI